MMWQAVFVLGVLACPKDIGAGLNGPLPPVPDVKPFMKSVSNNTVPSVDIILPERKPAQTAFSDIPFFTEFKTDLVSTPFPPHPSKKPMQAKRISPVSQGLVLSDQDAALYKQVFLKQKEGNWKEADRLLARIRDKTLMGHVLFQRYMHPTKYTSSFSELNAWLVHYADHPEAARIYKLAKAKMPSGYRGKITEPVSVSEYRGSLEYQLIRGKSYKSPLKRSGAQNASVRRLKKAIYSDIARQSPSKAFSRLKTDKTTRFLDHVERDILQADIAKSYMHEGKADKALQLSVDSLRHSARAAPVAGWVAGLISWRWGEYAFSASYFEKSAMSPYASAWMASAASYWAYRAHAKTGDVRKARYWLGRAALYPRTFYGLLAIEALGDDTPFNWNVPSLTKEYEVTLKKTSAGRRAIALVQSGQNYLAGQELFRLDPGANKSLKNALLAFAVHKNIPAYAYRFGNSFKDESGRLYDSALYPIGDIALKDAPYVDRALLHAIIRQESRFDPEAGNQSGATGLMQIMPATAAYVSGDKSLNSPAGRHRLKDPEVNVKIGQKYIAELLKDGTIDNDLLLLAAAYNAGPGNLRRWKSDLPRTNDPLLFIEMIPVSETRGYIQRVMRNLWVYRARLGQDAPSMRALVAGQPAKYASLDHVDRPIRLAELDLH